MVQQEVNIDQLESLDDTVKIQENFQLTGVISKPLSFFGESAFSQQIMTPKMKELKKIKADH